MLCYSVEHFKPSAYMDPLTKKIDYTYSFKNLFKDVITYPNDVSYYPTPTFKSGIQKCKENCKGTCVEQGQTGIAFCFPPYNY